jgi:hypothetical protein
MRRVQVALGRVSAALYKPDKGPAPHVDIETLKVLVENSSLSDFTARQARPRTLIACSRNVD